MVSKNKHERRKAAQEAEGLLVEERLNFEAWRDSLETVPTIKVRQVLCLFFFFFWVRVCWYW